MYFVLTLEGKGNEDCPGITILTGRVVGVLQRNWRDYVACFDEEEVSSSAHCSIPI